MLCGTRNIVLFLMCNIIKVSWIGKSGRIIRAADPCHIPLKWVRSASSFGSSAALLIRFSNASSWKWLLWRRCLWNGALVSPPTHHQRFIISLATLVTTGEESAASSLTLLTWKLEVNTEGENTASASQIEIYSGSLRCSHTGAIFSSFGDVKLGVCHQFQSTFPWRAGWWPTYGHVTTQLQNPQSSLEK